MGFWNSVRLCRLQIDWSRMHCADGHLQAIITGIYVVIFRFSSLVLPRERREAVNEVGHYGLFLKSA